MRVISVFVCSALARYYRWRMYRLWTAALDAEERHRMWVREALRQ